MREANTYWNVTRRIELNEFKRAFWMRWWELHCAKRWQVTKTPTIVTHKCGTRAGRPVAAYTPNHPQQWPLCIGKPKRQ